jgi:hypothetical protein
MQRKKPPPKKRTQVKPAKSARRPDWRDAPVASAVVRELKRLGARLWPDEVIVRGPVPFASAVRVAFYGTESGQWGNNMGQRPDPLGQVQTIPAAIHFLCSNLEWPRPVYSDDDGEKLNMAGASEGPDAVVDGKRRVLIPIAHTAVHFYQYYLDAFDTSDDPVLFFSDSDGFSLVRLRARLSKFLGGLSLTR